MKQRPTEEEFAELKRIRDDAILKMVREVRKKMWPDAPDDDGILTFHCRDYQNDCYCACPEGPCQHEFSGWRDILNDDDQVCGGEQVCQRCGCGSMSHSMRYGP
jgi:hypothetical protein